MPLLPSKSTAISDAVLGASCIWALYSIFQGDTYTGNKGRLSDVGMASNNLATVWFALTLAASTIGGFRFRKSFQSSSIIILYIIILIISTLLSTVKKDYFDRLAPLHDLLSWLVLVIGLPCLASQFYLNSGLPVLANLHLMLMLPPILSWLGKDR